MAAAIDQVLRDVNAFLVGADQWMLARTDGCKTQRRRSGCLGVMEQDIGEVL